MRPGALLKDPGVLLKDPGVLLKDPGILLKDPGVLLKSPGALLKDPVPPSGTQSRAWAKAPVAPASMRPGRTTPRSEHAREPW